MKYQVRFHPSAQNDLQDILNYISNHLNNPSSAKAIVRNIIKKCNSLAIFPKASTAKYAIGNTPICLTHIHKYAIAYTINNDASIVDIIAIIYSRRELAAILFKRN